MRKSALRGLVSCVLTVLFPISLLAADSGAAMLYTSGAAWVNGSHVPHTSSAIFTGDLLQTRSDSVANINQAGSTITVLSDTLLKFEGSSISVEHGGVRVATSRSVATTAGGVKVVPASNSWTEFTVSDLDGTVRIAARKGDLTISDSNGVATLAQGQETTRDESSDNDRNGKKKDRKRAAGAVPAAGGGVLTSPYAVIAGGAAIAAITTWVLVKSDDPASPTKP